ncbi:SDR family NAD(P)-dependent oxidoreductase [Desertibacillus haloalkaliphilus]|uniref:SDR family NAD(P)-dependent oxidoreductase n=1 Tax=Desertibacillus haloalkaliphilus TaxID=1328930 RepID=UPI001C27A555|nr:SDR family oxidoreductase [Desertibacillus haloalkaliphilus]MBU8906438.1 SDR family oxidoreductase [Desertibacillus haloalkaliphilus]
MKAKTILITGAGTGLGKELAVVYAQQGHRIILVGRTETSLNEVKEVIESQRGSGIVKTCDITDPNAVQEMIQQLLETETIDQVINNAGIGYFRTLQDLTMTEISQMLDTNVKGTIYVTKAVLPTFLERDSGKIMNIISTAGLRGKVQETAYVASKFAVRGFTESLIKELAGTSITVSAVYMGGMDTPFWDDSDFVTDRSRLRSASEVAREIVEREDEEKLIIE